jgi:hypothetical protein
MEHLAACLDAASTLRECDFETTFEFRVLPPGDAHGSSASDWVFLETFRYVALGDRLYIRRESFERTGGGARVTAMQENVWADGAGRIASWAVTHCRSRRSPARQTS